jgi:hypothetical protein
VNGTLLEAEMSGTNDYRDTLHPVKVLSWSTDGYYRCQLLAFQGETSIDFWSEQELHSPRSAKLNCAWNVGDHVHFLLRNRMVRGDYVDGLCSKKGIWVKGTVVAVLDDGVVVKHFNWTDKSAGADDEAEVGQGYVERNVHFEYLRPAKCDNNGE